MKRYEAPTIQKALELIAKDYGKTPLEMRPHVRLIETKTSLFGKTYVLGVFNANAVFAYACAYLDKALSLIEAKATYVKAFDKATKVITIDIVSPDSGFSIIGKNGETLKSLNTLVRSAVFNEFGGYYKILLDCNGYKKKKYEKIRLMAQAAAKDVLTSHIPSPLPPMTSDERRIVHEALAGMHDIDDPSVDTGKKRHIVIQYVPGNIAKADIKEKDVR